MGRERDYVRTELDGRIAILTVDRPPVNAYNYQTHREIHEAFVELEDDPGVRCVVLAAAGVDEGRPFGAGSDIKEFVALDPVTSLRRARDIRAYYAHLSNYPLPVVAAVENVVLGSGLTWASRADIRVISTSASLGMPELKAGALGGGKELVRLFGPGKAREMYYTGNQIEAEEAYRLGFGQRLVPEGKALAEACALALEIAEQSRFGLLLAKEQMIAAELIADREAAYKYETELTAIFRATPDASESARAFLEKRRPRFTTDTNMDGDV